ncbi:SubName: Full=Uncharacterized protein {ECO:0000313/EMBL:CCA71208.1} [Serendipita indica DSM 11827]|nr:SubName: Full=Uncharacterized protein {ECO:0000313/EMBL:CCA71208.1} [Serendipita indica DSM 11827]
MDNDTAAVTPPIVTASQDTQDDLAYLLVIASFEEHMTSPEATNLINIPGQHKEGSSGSRHDINSTFMKKPHAFSECIVCGSDEDDVAIPNVPATGACDHPPEICVDCLKRIIETSISTGAFISGIPCPSIGCGQIMTYFDVQKWAETKVFQRYDTLLFQNSLRSDSTWVWCVSPSCEAGQEHTGGDASNIVTCHACGSKMCFRHQSAWHEGMSCAQWDEQLLIAEHGERWTDEWILTETKGCPKCKARILKNEGCDHMTCRRPGGCGHEFCWECLAPWREIFKDTPEKRESSCAAGLSGYNPFHWCLETNLHDAERQ